MSHVNSSPPSPPHWESPRRLSLSLGLFASLVTSAWIVPVGCSGERQGGDVTPESRRTTAPGTVKARTPAPPDSPETPYLNARPGVAYMGDTACVSCHKEISASYRKHPMGRSLAALATDSPPGLVEKADFQAEGFDYSVERRQGRVIHREVRRDAGGKVVASMEAEVQYVLGSGTRGYSFLIERDGYLVQSPIAWYAQDRKWNLAPGYHEKNEHFERQVIPECLFCHVNQVAPVPGTLNRYQSPIFRGHAIGCERCHGPGELHVARTEFGDDKDLTIVNPIDLVPRRREGVCEQCHLQGETRFPRAGRAVFDYRPGLPIEDYWAVFVRPESPKANKIVGHVEQMRASRCFQASAGKLGCVSCHDPHERPAPEAKMSYYRSRCLECHADRGCSFPEPLRRKRSPEDSCVSCHMPSSASNVVHTAQTIHRIPRFGEFDGIGAKLPGSPRPDVPLLEDFYQEAMSASGRSASGRDLALALTIVGDRELGTDLASSMGRAALPLAESAAAAHPDDPGAWLAKAGALRLVGRNPDALTAIESLLTREPRHEAALVFAGVIAGELDRRNEALAYWRRLLVVNPWLSRAHLAMARLHAASSDWIAAAESCRAALRINPAQLAARKLLVDSLLATGDPEGARVESATLKAFETGN